MPWRAFIDSDTEEKHEHQPDFCKVLMPWRAFIDSDNIRVCAYAAHGGEVLMPWRAFIDSDVTLMLNPTARTMFVS